MKIAPYNVNGVIARLPVLLRWLKEQEPDIVCLQELKAPQQGFPATALRDAGYEAIWQGQKSWNGVAILLVGARLWKRAVGFLTTRRTVRADTSKARSMA